MRRERTRFHQARTTVLSRPQTTLLLALLLGLWLPASESRSAGEAEDSCVACHGDRTFLVTNPKLYDYFQKWTSSIHRQEQVTCVDCHGGNAKAADKDRAHGAELEASEKGSAVNFRNIPRTCGECHDEIYQGFRKSSHFEHLVAKSQADQGPTCVTCHGSINVAVLNVVTVEQACSRCHNQESENNPEIPEEARSLLNRFLSIHRYYRYITVRGEPEDTRKFFNKVDAQIHELSITWHTFDLAEIKRQTEAVLDSVKKKREEVARSYKEGRQKR